MNCLYTPWADVVVMDAIPGPPGACSGFPDAGDWTRVTRTASEIVAAPAGLNEVEPRAPLGLGNPGLNGVP